MTPKEAVDLPLPWPVFTISRGRSLLDLFLSRLSLGSRVSLMPPFSSRRDLRDHRRAGPPGAGTEPPSPQPPRPPSRAERILPPCRPRTTPPRGSADARPPLSGRVLSSHVHRSGG